MISFQKINTKKGVDAGWIVVWISKWFVAPNCSVYVCGGIPNASYEVSTNHQLIWVLRILVWWCWGNQGAEGSPRPFSGVFNDAIPIVIAFAIAGSYFFVLRSYSYVINRYDVDAILTQSLLERSTPKLLPLPYGSHSVSPRPLHVNQSM